MFRWKATAFSITLDKNVRFETRLLLFRILQSILWLFINGFTMAAFVDLGKTPRDNDFLTTFVIGLIKTSRQYFRSHVGIGSTAQTALDDLFSNCLISVTVKGPNVSIIDIQVSSFTGLPCVTVLEGNPSCIFNIFWQRKFINNGPYLYSSWYYLEGQADVCVIRFNNTENSPLIFLGWFDLFIIIFWFSRGYPTFKWLYQAQYTPKALQIPLTLK